MKRLIKQAAAQPHAQASNESTAPYVREEMQALSRALAAVHASVFVRQAEEDYQRRRTPAPLAI